MTVQRLYHTIRKPRTKLQTSLTSKHMKLVYVFSYKRLTVYEWLQSSSSGTPNGCSPSYSAHILECCAHLESDHGLLLPRIPEPVF